VERDPGRFPKGCSPSIDLESLWPIRGHLSTYKYIVLHSSIMIGRRCNSDVFVWWAWSSIYIIIYRDVSGITVLMAIPHPSKWGSPQNRDDLLWWLCYIPFFEYRFIPFHSPTFLFCVWYVQLLFLSSPTCSYRGTPSIRIPTPPAPSWRKRCSTPRMPLGSPRRLRCGAGGPWRC
jgi:hypothetical protein